MKLYADEEGHEAVRGVGTFVISCLARVEVPAAIWRKHRIGELSVDDVAVLVSDFEADLTGEHGTSRFAVLGLPMPVLDDAARLVAVHGLQAYDGVQLASALAARAAEPACDCFACFDDSLRVAAVSEGLTLLP
ncbi:MAG: type II toxin-antitoxin system VapC family toxin [Acidimicrobiales bacterium]